MLDVQLHGLSPAGHHQTSLLLHLANTLLLFLALHLLRSAIAAAPFGVHPLHVESVAWVAERKDAVSGLFWMLCLLAYIRHVRAPRRAATPGPPQRSRSACARSPCS